MYIGNVEIKRREVIFSVVIISIMLCTGFIIGNKINDWQMQKNAEYYTAVQIDDDKSLFEYGMKTNIGNAFVYGDIKAINPVSYNNVKGEYSYIERITEKYTQHERVVTHSDGKRTWTTVEVYYTWDEIASEDKHSAEISLLNVTFPYNKFILPKASYITTVDTDYRLRDVFYGVKAEFKGTVYTALADNTIRNNSELYDGRSIKETLDYLTSNSVLITFWVIWILVMIGIVVVFYILDNRWLDG